MLGLAGPTVIEVSTGPTVSVVCAKNAPDTALMFAVPGLTPVAKPAPLTVAMPVADEVQVAVLVTSCVVPSL